MRSAFSRKTLCHTLGVRPGVRSATRKCFSVNSGFAVRVGGLTRTKYYQSFPIALWSFIGVHRGLMTQGGKKLKYAGDKMTDTLLSC